MLSRIFCSRGKKVTNNVHLSDSGDDSWFEDFHLTERGLPTLDRSKIRVLVFKDHDRKGDKCVLFDQQNARRNEHQQKEAECSRPIRRRSSSDAALLGEMVFGSVEMTYKGPTVKAHIIRTPPQLLLTKVFALKPQRASTHSSSHGHGTEEMDGSYKLSESVKSELSISRNTSSDDLEQQMVKSVPMAMKLDSINDHAYKLQNVVEDFTHSMSGSASSLVATPQQLTSSGSYQRRMLRSQTTRMDYMCSRRNEMFNEEMSMRLRRRPKIGLAVLFSLWEEKDTSEENNRLFQNFCFSHFPVIETHIHRLRRTIEKALLVSFQNPAKSFHDAVFNASNIFCDSILDLYYAPRIRSPIWLTMLSRPDQCDDICKNLVPQLVNLIQTYNTKDTNFFMSSLLTAVLTYHVAWVTTVTPSCVQARRAYLDKHSSEMLNVLGVSHPYNPLWAQLSDLYGSGGNPTKLTRTVLVGKDKTLVTILLHILTYFIRCSEVNEQPELMPDFTQQQNTPLLLSTETFTESDNVFEISENISEKQRDGTLVTDLKDRSNDEPTVSLMQNCEQCCQKDTQNDSLIVEQTLGCHCNSVLSGDSKENRLWKSFLRTSCHNRHIDKCLKSGSKCVTLDDSWLSKTRTNISTEVKSRRHSTESNHRNIYCIQNDGKTISLDKQSIVTMFQTSFPFCPICQGKLSFIERDYYHRESTCDLTNCERNCSCEMINENNDKTMFGSSTTMNSEGYSSGISLDIQSLDNISVDSGLNIQCTAQGNVKTVKDCSKYSQAETIDDECFKQPCILDLPGFYPERSEDEYTADLKCQLFSFGRSLMAGYCDKYLPDFVLHGTDECTEEQLKYDLKISLEQPAIDSPVLESVLIIGNTDKWECKVMSLQKPKKGPGNNTCISDVKKNEYSDQVHSFLTSFCHLWEMNMSAQFCLIHLEDKMKEIFLRSKVISDYLITQTRYVTTKDLMNTFGYNQHDLALLMSVIGVHSPTAVSRIPLF